MAGARFLQKIPRTAGKIFSQTVRPDFVSRRTRLYLCTAERNGHQMQRIRMVEDNEEEAENQPE